VVGGTASDRWNAPLQVEWSLIVRMVSDRKKWSKIGGIVSDRGNGPRSGERLSAE
jgi:hypothetical protein